MVKIRKFFLVSLSPDQLVKGHTKITKLVSMQLQFRDTRKIKIHDFLQRFSKIADKRASLMDLDLQRCPKFFENGPTLEVKKESELQFLAILGKNFDIYHAFIKN